jgi:hypothetical protein
MQPGSVVPFTAQTPYTDPLGTRLVITDRPGERLEQLRFAPELLSPGFEAALRERVAQLAQFRHPCYARVRRVDRLDGGAALAVVSDHPRGPRLSDVLAVAEREGLDLDINAALCVVRQLVPAIAALHLASPGAAHGTLSPERIVVTSHARIVITEHVVGPAIEQLRLSRHDLWRDLRIMAPPTGDGAPRLDRRADIVQIGAVSLALVLGRPLRVEELDTLPELLASARETTVLGRRELVAAPLRRWLLRALHLDPRGSFQSAVDAQEGLEDVLSEEGGYIAAPIALESFLTRYQEHAALSSRVPAPVEVRPAIVASQAAAVPANPDVRPAVAPANVAVKPASMTIVAAAAGSSQAEPGAEQEPNAIAAAPKLLPAARPAEQVLDNSAAKGTTSFAPASIEQSATPSEPERGMSSSEREQLKEFLDEIGSVGAETRADAGLDGATTKYVEFPSRGAEPELSERSVRSARFTRERLALIVCALVAAGEGAYIWNSAPAAVPVSSEGRLSIDSRPAGATVVIDDKERGVTPLSLSLSPGAHVMALRTADSSRAVSLTIQAGVTYAQYVELAPMATTGSIDVLLDTPGARVLLDGQPRGIAPVIIADVAPGDHDLVIEARTGVVHQRVAVQAGLTTSVRPTSTPPSPVETGWVTIEVPFEMQVLEAGRRIGTTSTPKLPLAPGRHRLEIVSEALAFRTTTAVDVVSGKETRVPVQLPKGSVAINALPWAEVWIDGQKAGETPIGSIALTLGPHELVFKHPDYPDRHHAVSVTAGEPTRVSVEMKK